MRDRITIALGAAIAVIVLLSLGAYAASVGARGYAELTVPAIAMVLVAFATYILWDRSRSVSKGLPAADERLKNANYKAGYYGFIAAIWSAVFIPLATDVLFGLELEGSQVTAAVVLVSGCAFAASYLYLARRGD